MVSFDPSVKLGRSVQFVGYLDVAQVVETSVTVTDKSFSGLPSPGQSHYKIDCHSGVQTLYCKTRNDKDW